MLGINLLKNTSEYIGINKFFKVITYISYVTVCIFLLCFVTSFIILGQRKADLSVLDNKKSALLLILKNNVNVEAELTNLAVKNETLNKYLKEDVEFLPYYNILIQAVNQNETKATIEDASIDKDKNFSFSVRFNNFDQFISFFSYVEKDIFLQNFDKISITNLYLTEKKDNKQYILEFNGKFSQIKNGKI